MKWGGKIETNTEVQQIIVKNDRVSAVKTDKIIYKSDIVVCNADYPYAVKNLFHKNVEAELRSERHMIKKKHHVHIHDLFRVEQGNLMNSVCIIFILAETLENL